MQDKKKKPTDMEVGEMGGRSLKAEFDEAMQKQFMSRPENQKKNSKPSVNVKRVIEIAKKRGKVKTEMGSKDMSRPKN
jgi:hypothetical protein